jgi:hypothetical protein
MASYDSPGFHNLMPGIPDRDSAMSAPGSVVPERPDTSGPLGDRLQAGTLGDSAVITPVGASLANADVVTVGPRDTLIPSEAQMYDDHADLLTGVTGLGQTGAGQGFAYSHNPNSMNRPVQ